MSPFPRKHLSIRRGKLYFGQILKTISLYINSHCAFNGFWTDKSDNRLQPQRTFYSKHSLFPYISDHYAPMYLTILWMEYKAR